MQPVVVICCFRDAAIAEQITGCHLISANEQLPWLTTRHVISFFVDDANLDIIDHAARGVRYKFIRVTVEGVRHNARCFRHAIGS